MTSSTIAPTYRTQDSGISACLEDNKYIIFFFFFKRGFNIRIHTLASLPFFLLGHSDAKVVSYLVFHCPKRPIFTMTSGANIS